MKKLLLLLLLIAAFSAAKAQKYYITNQYLYDLYLMNPAGAGFYKGCYEFSGYYQKQWFGMDDAPTTQVLSYQGPLTESLGMGAYFYNDRNGFYSEMGFQASLSYEVMFTKKRRRTASMTFGMSINAEQSSVDQTQLTDGALLDPTLSGANESGWGFNSNAGILFKYNDYHVGFSVTNILPQNNPMYSHEDEPALTSDIHIHGGTTFKIADRDIFLEPLIMYRRNMLVDSKLDMSVKGFFPTPDPNLSLWGLVSYRRTMDHQFGKSLGLGVTAGVQLNNFLVGLEYQLGLTGAQLDYGSAYQLICKYRICKDKSKASIPCSERNRNKRNKAIKRLKLKR
ncbi:type IX secretion system membrane protein PorP/SprF [Carboxylicivirga sp. A043]|uniref:PorP/SprF family type IX secretion system membrane protein n=1 Tax=Carboxylicivirga litoralis TaxID=2816963 RepID=UPI0021CB5375|nr:type IX secretion system membrane protein PorP/SprF [Carboxylicivirga sp. A043]MCU4154688.1 type IX secretion system membrane protein PorP/SprF [Carboxylicivirga sp. A043]